MLRLIAGIALMTLLPIVIIIFFFTHFGLILWLALILAIASAIYGVVVSRSPT